ncbi:MAG: hypothetical protein F6K47_31665 [Symploca sp. SIO2E6]|nr:hypothetical protein [Symploca sp. SIO2E6]
MGEESQSESEGGGFLLGIALDIGTELGDSGFNFPSQTEEEDVDFQWGQVKEGGKGSKGTALRKFMPWQKFRRLYPIFPKIPHPRVPASPPRLQLYMGTRGREHAKTRRESLSVIS